MENNPKFFFDYIYYRVAKFYFKREGRNSISAILFVTLIQALLIIIILGILYKTVIPQNIVEKMYSFSKPVAMILVGTLSFVNYYKFKNKYFIYKSYWKNDSKKIEFIKGILVLLSGILPWIPIVLLGTIFK